MDKKKDLNSYNKFNLKVSRVNNRKNYSFGRFYVIKKHIKQVSILHHYKKKQKIDRKQNLYRFSFPFFLNNNIGQKKMLFLSQNISFNPIFGGLTRGFPFLLKQVGFREDISLFLRPKWYRLDRMESFRKKLLNIYDIRLFNEGFIKKKNFLVNVMKKESIDYIIQYFLQKRWFLKNLLKNG